MNLILQCLWFLISPGVANLIPPIAAKLWPAWNTPADLGFHFRGLRTFGDHKTMRGLVTGTVAGYLAFEIHQFLQQQHLYLNSIDVLRSEGDRWWMGFASTNTNSDNLSFQFVSQWPMRMAQFPQESFFDGRPFGTGNALRFSCLNAATLTGAYAGESPADRIIQLLSKPQPTPYEVTSEADEVVSS